MESRQARKNAPARDVDTEIRAISAVYNALRNLQPEAQLRVLNYVSMKLGLETSRAKHDISTSTKDTETAQRSTKDVTQDQQPEAAEDELGISPLARKWMSRNGLQIDKLSTIFSIGVDEIDVVAKVVPGDSKKEKMHNVVLLKGIAAYLATGAPRFTHEEIKEACLHYGAFDANNFHTHLKHLSSEVSGSRSAGYTLTARGITGATELIKRMTS